VGPGQHVCSHDRDGQPEDAEPGRPGRAAGDVFKAIAVAGVVLIAAAGLAAISPIRRRVQRAVDRRFNRARYGADQTVAVFVARLEDAVDLDTVRDDSAGVVHRPWNLPTYRCRSANATKSGFRRDQHHQPYDHDCSCRNRWHGQSRRATGTESDMAPLGRNSPLLTGQVFIGPLRAAPGRTRPAAPDPRGSRRGLPARIHLHPQGRQAARPRPADRRGRSAPVIGAAVEVRRVPLRPAGPHSPLATDLPAVRPAAPRAPTLRRPRRR